eukprot:5204508-Prymnesium_polylepis.1
MSKLRPDDWEEGDVPKRRARAVALFDDWIHQLSESELKELQLERKRWTKQGTAELCRPEVYDPFANWLVNDY